MGCSVAIVAKNEEARLRACMESCASFATEYVVIDDFSTDATREIAESFPNTRVIQRALNSDFGGQQTFGIEQCTEEWVYMIDADEVCTPELAAEIKAAIAHPPEKAYWMRRLNHFGQTPVRHGPLAPDWVLRLVPQKGSSVRGKVHPKNHVAVPTDRLKGFMKHYTYRNWEHYEKKMNFYSTIGAQRYFDEKKRSSPVFDVVVRPFVAFFKMYVLKRGFLDGRLGWMLCHQYANYTMAKYIKLDELHRAK